MGMIKWDYGKAAEVDNSFTEMSANTDHTTAASREGSVWIVGIYLNPENAAFEMSRFSDIYIDKSMLIAKMNAVYRTERRFVCVSRPRRFGKSMVANMLSAYYSRGCDSKALFTGLGIEQNESYRKHLNRHNVIRLDIQQFLFQDSHLDIFIEEIQKAVTEELTSEYGDCFGKDPYGLPSALRRIYAHTGKGFIFIIDEWDCVFRTARNRQEIQKKYLDFLRGLFKGQEYVDLAYMTGILPIKKYGEHSAINIFDEYSMIDPADLADFFGFTEDEVRGLCSQKQTDFLELQKWYDGYVLNGLHIYNPKSVVDVVRRGKFKSYWTGTETYEALKVYIDLNFDGLKEAIIQMLGNIPCKVNTRKFQNDMTTFRTRDDVLTLLVHLGYLAYDESDGKVRIPNREIAQEFLNAVDGPGWDGLLQSLERSGRLLESTWAMDGQAVAEEVAAIHSETSSILKYNDENSLTCTILMAYYSAKAYYMPQVLELPSGKGFADVVYLPLRNVDRPALVVELKWNKSAEGAIAQIRERQYTSWIENYTGDILLVGISYDEKKGHQCVIEKYKK